MSVVVTDDYDGTMSCLMCGDAGFEAIIHSAAPALTISGHSFTSLTIMPIITDVMCVRCPLLRSITASKLNSLAMIGCARKCMISGRVKMLTLDRAAQFRLTGPIAVMNMDCPRIKNWPRVQIGELRIRAKNIASEHAVRAKHITFVDRLPSAWDDIVLRSSCDVLTLCDIPAARMPDCIKIPHIVDVLNVIRCGVRRIDVGTYRVRLGKVRFEECDLLERIDPWYELRSITYSGKGHPIIPFIPNLQALVMNSYSRGLSLMYHFSQHMPMAALQLCPPEDRFEYINHALCRKLNNMLAAVLVIERWWLPIARDDISCIPTPLSM